MDSCTTHFVQYAGLAGLNAPKQETQDILNILKERRDALVKILSEIEGVEVHMPEAGFYVFPKELLILDHFCSFFSFQYVKPNLPGIYIPVFWDFFRTINRTFYYHRYPITRFYRI